jgi:hypothetical protein
MKKKNITKVIALLSASSMAFTGCGSFVSEDVASYPLAASLTSAELIDYYSAALDYDAVVTRNVTVHETTYETKDIQGEKATKLEELYKACEAILGENEYEPTVDSLKLVSEDTFYYIKGVLDNDVLSNGTVKNITGALGYYFVDVEYDLSAKTPGTFTTWAQLVGLNGAILHNDYLDTYSLSSSYAQAICTNVNEYFVTNKVSQILTYDPETLELTLADGDPSTYSNKGATTDGTDGSGDTSTDGSLIIVDNPLTDPGDENETDEDLSDIETTDTVTEDGTDAETTDVETTDVDETDVDETVIDDGEAATDNIEETTTDDKSETTTGEAATTDTVMSTLTSTSGAYTRVTPIERRNWLDVGLMNKLVGSSIETKATMPELTSVFNIPEAEGVISGYGIANSGSNGLKIFGYDRDKLSGTVSLRYVFKDDSNGTGDILGTNIYVTEEQITNGITVSSNTPYIAEFLQSELEQIVERSDRVQVNCDLAGALSSDLYEDIGNGILLGFKDKNTNTTKYMSKIRQVLGSDKSNNAYLLEVETTTIEGPKDVDIYGTYKDTYYIVVQQQDTEFEIIDMMRTSRTMTHEPEIDPDSNILKRLIALNLAGEISDDNKTAIKSLMSELYTAGTNRLLYGPSDITVNGETVTLTRGMYDCFSSDTSILTTDDKEYINSSIRNILTGIHGVDTSAYYSGSVVEWLGGYDNQAEFITQETVTYSGYDDYYEMTVYYLVSIENDEWVIDERTVIDEELVDGTASSNTTANTTDTSSDTSSDVSTETTEATSTEQ